MKAVVLREHGDLDTLRYETDFPDPVVTEGHVVTRVRATSFFARATTSTSAKSSISSRPTTTSAATTRSRSKT